MTIPEPEIPQFINTIELVSSESSKIEKVSLYSGRAEITRSYKLAIKTGQNQVKISGLPAVLDNDSLRVEGRGAATIQGVTITQKDWLPPTTTSEALETLQQTKEVTEKAAGRCRKAIASLESYISTLKTDTVGGDGAWDLLDKYESRGEKLDARLLQLELALKQISKNIEEEKKRLAALNKTDDKLTNIATIDIFADVEGPVTIILVYAVYNANWEAVYDIRVQMDVADTPVKLIYKAAITQTTGESWDDASLTLETVTPTFGVQLPQLQPWKITVYHHPLEYAVTSASSKRLLSVSALGSQRKRVSLPSAPESEDDMGFEFERQETVIANKGNLSTSFQVPGLVSIPSGSDARSVTITQLNLGATMHWMTIPRAEAKVHLKAKIKNASDFPLLPGTASIYVDGSFISKTQVPASSPQESFDCPLGPDPSIRVTYHPLSKKASESGFYSKSFSTIYTQLMTIHNTKTTPVNDLTVIDHIPVSEDSRITVKLVDPALTLPTGSGLKVSSGKVEKPQSVTISKGITASWDGVDDPEADIRSLGRNGRIAWKCAVPEQGKINATLVWEVSAPSNVKVTGL